MNILEWFVSVCPQSSCVRRVSNIDVYLDLVIIGAKYSTRRNGIVPMQRRLYSQGTKYHQMRFWKLDGRNAHLRTGLLPVSRLHRGWKGNASSLQGQCPCQSQWYHALSIYFRCFWWATWDSTTIVPTSRRWRTTVKSCSSAAAVLNWWTDLRGPPASTASRDSSHE